MPKLHVPPASTVSKPGTVHFESKCNDSDKPRHPSAVALDGTVRPPVGSISGQLAKPELSQARQPLTQWNQAPSVPPQIAAASRFEELVAEADTLLHKLKTVQPVRAEELDDHDAALASKRQQAASRNKLAIVRVRVSHLSLHLLDMAAPVGYIFCSKQQQSCQNGICFRVQGAVPNQ